MAQVESSMENLFRARWRSASPKQQEFLAAMARHGGSDVRREQIAEALHADTRAISMVLSTLVEN
jgi:hypothetical protein